MKTQYNRENHVLLDYVVQNEGFVSKITFWCGRLVFRVKQNLSNLNAVTEVNLVELHFILT